MACAVIRCQARARHMPGLVLLIAVAVISASCGGGYSAQSRSTSPSSRHEQRKIIFSVSGDLPSFAGRHACAGLYAVNVDGSRLVRLSGPRWDYGQDPLDPVHADVPNLVGFLAFGRPVAEGRPQSVGLFELNTATGRVDLMKSMRTLVFPRIAWKPGGRSFVTLERVGNDSVLERVGRGGSSSTVLSSDFAFFPAWSPSGYTITYSIERRNGDWSIWRLDPTGRNKRLLIRNAGDARWSPDGRRFAFFRPGDPGFPGGAALWVADRDGRRAHRVAKRVAHANGAPLWSPDSKRLLFVRRPQGSYQGEEVDAGNLYVHGLRTGSERLLKHGVVPADWLPSGREILFLRPHIVGGEAVWGLYRTPLRGGRESLLAVMDQSDLEAGSLPSLQTHPRALVPVKQSAGGDSARFEIRPFGFSCLSVLHRLRASLARPS